MDECKELPNHSCGPNDICEYTFTYLDGSHSAGDLALEAFTIGTVSSSTFVQQLVFGCGHSNTGLYDANLNGVIGLGGGMLSMVSQLGVGGRRFSYCLTTQADSNSKISFGSDAVVSGDGFVTTRMITKEGEETYYFITLKSFTLESHTIPFARNKEDEIKRSRGIHGGDDFDQEGNVIIDSGATFTYMPQYMIDGIIQLLEEVITLPKVPDPRNKFQLCYPYNGKKIELPSLIANFENAEVVLQPINIFRIVGNGIFCFAMLPKENYGIFGNLAQLNFLVGYDLEAHAVSFKPTDCAHQQ